MNKIHQPIGHGCQVYVTAVPMMKVKKETRAQKQPPSVRNWTVWRCASWQLFMAIESELTKSLDFIVIGYRGYFLSKQIKEKTHVKVGLNVFSPPVIVLFCFCQIGFSSNICD